LWQDASIETPVRMDDVVRRRGHGRTALAWGSVTAAPRLQSRAIMPIGVARGRPQRIGGIPMNSIEKRPVSRTDPHPLGSTLAGWIKSAAGEGKEAAGRWVGDSCFRLGASLAYYALFSIFPLFLLAIAGLGFFLGDDSVVRDKILASVANATTPDFRSLLDQTLVSMQSHQTARGVGAVVGVVTLFFGASGVFAELQTSINTIWRVKAAPSSGFGHTVLNAIRDKAFSFLAVLGAGGVLLATLVVSTALSALTNAADHVFAAAFAWQGLDALVSLGLSALVFAVLFKLLPQTAVAWRDVLGGALLTAVLFDILKHLLAWYLGHLGSYAAYGAVGAVLGLLTWIYLASLVVFFGAEYTRVHAEKAGSLAGKAPAPDPPPRAT
jgi:membrane protein